MLQPPSRSLLVSFLLTVAVTAPVFSAQQVNWSQPSFSPDGKKVVYVVNNKELWTNTLDGRNANILISGEGAMRPRFSFDGKKLVFSRQKAGEANTDLWTLGVDDSGEKRITSTPGHAEAAPEFLADGSVVFARRERPIKADGKLDMSKVFSTPKEPWFRIYDASSGAVIPDEVDPFPKTLGLVQFFPATDDVGYALASTDLSDGKPQAGKPVNRIFGVGNGRFILEQVGSVGVIDSILSFRRARSIAAYVLEVQHNEIIGGASTRQIVLVHPGMADVRLDADMTLVSFDISADGSKVVAAGFKGHSDDDSTDKWKILLYDVATKRWSQIAPDQG